MSNPSRTRGSVIGRVERAQGAGLHDGDSTCAYEWCSEKRSDHLRAPLCDRHAIAVYRDMRDLLSSNQAAAIPDILDQILSEREQRPVVANFNPKVNDPVVYFIAFGDRIKIGTSANVKRRMSQLPVDTLLGTIPGSRDKEAQMHARFASARVGKTEWFTRSPELLAFIEGIQAA